MAKGGTVEPMVPAREAPISAREAEVLTAVGQHLTHAESATRLFISIHTVETYVSSLLRKLGASDRRTLAAEQAVPAAATEARPRRPSRPRR